MRLLGLVVVLGLIVSVVGCISFSDNAVIISLGNQTYTIPLNQTTNQTSNKTVNQELYNYSYEVQVGEELYIRELNFTIRPDYDISKQKFFFATPQGVYWEPMNITVENITILGESYFAGTSIYISKITIESPRELSIEIREVNSS